MSVTVAWLFTVAVNSLEFGHDFLKYYAMDPTYLNLNFGSYGLAPLPVLQNQSNWRATIESCPDRWFRYNRTPSINQVQQLLAEYLHITDWADLVFTLNASHGVNAILRSIADRLYYQCVHKQTSKCNFLYFSTAYDMVSNTFDYIVETFGDQLNVFEFTVAPAMFTNSTLLCVELDAFLQSIDAANSIYLASISHIVSVPAVILDVKSIQALLRSKYNIMVMVDAAHTLGHIDVNISDIDPDIYISNGHKWLYSPRGSSILYVRKALQSLIYPTVISQLGQGSTPFQKNFNYEGTNDHTAWLSMAAALDYRENVCGGDEKIKRYIHSLCVDVGDLLVHQIWNTSNLVADEDYYGAMVNIQVPTRNISQCQWLRDTIFENKDNDQYYSFVAFFIFENNCYVRLSCQIFNEMADYQWFATRVLDLLNFS